jgi:hypothetical protein
MDQPTDGRSQSLIEVLFAPKNQQISVRDEADNPEKGTRCFSGTPQIKKNLKIHFQQQIKTLSLRSVTTMKGSSSDPK